MKTIRNLTSFRLVPLLVVFAAGHLLTAGASDPEWTEPGQEVLVSVVDGFENPPPPSGWLPSGAEGYFLRCDEPGLATLTISPPTDWKELRIPFLFVSGSASNDANEARLILSGGEGSDFEIQARLRQTTTSHPHEPMVALQIGAEQETPVDVDIWAEVWTRESWYLPRAPASPDAAQLLQLTLLREGEVLRVRLGPAREQAGVQGLGVEMPLPATMPAEFQIAVDLRPVPGQRLSAWLPAPSFVP